MRKIFVGLSLVSCICSGAQAMPPAVTYTEVKISAQVSAAIESCVTATTMKQKQDACFAASTSLKGIDPLKSLLYAKEGAKAGSAGCMIVAGYDYMVDYNKLGLTASEGVR